jgi:hypothetical protein
VPEPADGGLAPALALKVVLPPYQLDALAQRVTDLLNESARGLRGVPKASGATSAAVTALTPRPSRTLGA